jgi:hypothetical protein
MRAGNQDSRIKKKAIAVIKAKNNCKSTKLNLHFFLDSWFLTLNWLLVLKNK